MKLKKHTLFFIISFTIFVISVIAGIIFYGNIIVEMERLIAESNDTQYRFGMEMSIIFTLFFVFAVYAAGLSFIRSVYKILKYKIKGGMFICYVISAIMCLLAIALYCTIEIFNISLVVDGRAYLGDVYLFVLWPSFIISFILGSLPVRDFKGNDILSDDI